MRRLVQRRLQPGIVLQDVGDNVAMEQRRAFRNSGGAAGILQERDIVGTDRWLVQRQLAARGKSIVERNRAWNRKRRHHLLDLAHDEIDDDALEAEQVAHGAHDDVLDVRLRQHLFERARKVFQNDDRFRAGIRELVFELTRRIERIDVHNGETRAQNGG